MRVLVLTSSEHGTAPLCLPELCASERFVVAGVIYSSGFVLNKRRHYWRKARKFVKIGALGALNGLRMRSWYEMGNNESVTQLAEKLQVPIFRTATINCEATRKLFRELQTDLGLSLGNAYIGEAVFSIPRLGMINVHTEILPDYQGARSVLWPIYEGKRQTGFTIHQVDKGIDTGDILYRETWDIEFGTSLKDTVRRNTERLRERIPRALREVCENYEKYRATATSQKGLGKTYTTPSICQFMRMARNHRRLRVALPEALARGEH